MVFETLVCQASFYVQSYLKDYDFDKTPSIRILREISWSRPEANVVALNADGRVQELARKHEG